MKLLFSLLHKEFLLLGKAINGILSVLVLITSIVFIFNYALEQTGRLDRQTLIGIKWSVLFLTSYVFIGQSAWEERESGGGRISSLFLPVWMRFLSKSLVVFIGLSIAAIYLMILLSVFFQAFSLGWKDLFVNLIFLLPGVLCISFLGVALSHISDSSRLKEILLPLLMIPFTIPILLFGMEAERKLERLPVFDPIPGLSILLSFCVFMQESEFYFWNFPETNPEDPRIFLDSTDIPTNTLFRMKIRIAHPFGIGFYPQFFNRFSDCGFILTQLSERDFTTRDCSPNFLFSRSGRMGRSLWSYLFADFCGSLSDS
ncbi:CcmB protein [Leptospira interrogans serovar Copenhageni str. LT2050]|uniref:CcmB protein n=2 Tax=Leptospira interrogans TaxID=173 RepID=M3HNL2_LEPIT|nr:CcmB protein [Leptospira interrogans serovar Copenhageni str. LT2050]